MTTYINKSPYTLGQFGEQLETMTSQDVFNIAAEHLVLQGVKSVDVMNLCAYNGVHEGVKVCCAAAPFIKDYEEGMENLPFKDLYNVKDNVDLVQELQIIHDGSEPLEWKEELRDLAANEGLELPEILGD